MRQQILQRDGHQCRWPGCTENRNHLLEVHHRIPIEDAPHLKDDLANQITLCLEHHKLAAADYRRHRRSSST